MIEIFLVFALAIGLGWPLGLYLARVMRGDKSRARPRLQPGRTR